MTDFDYEVKERRNLAGQAKNRKRGSRSKKCTLPSDNLTLAEIRKKNGAISVYKIGKPISWDEFKSYPNNIQREYLEWIRDNLNANPALTANMFDVAANTQWAYFKSNGLLGILPRGQKEAVVVEFIKWLKANRETPVELKPEPEKKHETVRKPKDVVIPVFNVISCGELHLSGSAAEIGQSIWRIFGEAKLEMDITFSVSVEPKTDVVDEKNLPEVENEPDGIVGTDAG